jgi:hypothetical protein
VAYEPRRTLLVGLSALAVVLTAALFPAAGVGSHPAGPVGVADPGDDVPEVTPTPTPEPVDTPTPTDRDETPEDDPTPTSERTEAPNDDENEGGGGPWLPEMTLAALFGALLKLLGTALLASGLLALGVVLRGAEPGTPHVELPFGYSITLPFVVPAWAGRLGTRVSRLTMGFVVSISASVTQLLDAVGAAITAVTGGLGIVAGEGLRGTLALLGRLPSALARALSGLTTLPAGLLSLPAALSTVGGSISGATDRPGEDARAAAAPTPEPGDGPDESGPASVEEAWLAMVDMLPVERTPSTTPTELARRAADRGVPAAPVERVTRAFEDVVYGGYEPGDRATAAREALGRLRDRLGGGR